MNDKIKQVEEWFRVRGLDTAEPSKQMLKLLETGYWKMQLVNLVI